MFTIVIAGFNCADTIGETLTSCIHASHEGELCNEIIYYDDGSTDSSLKIVQEIASTNVGKIKIKTLSGPNRGVSFARNTAIDEARNELVALIDSDDLMTVSRLKEQKRVFISDENIDFISGGCLVAYKMYMSLFQPQNKKIRRSDLIYNPIINPTLSFKKSAFLEVGKYNEKNKTMTEDLELHYNILNSGKTLHTCENIWCTYRERQSPRKFKAYLNILYLHMKNKNRLHLAIFYFFIDILVLTGIHQPRSWIK